MSILNTILGGSRRGGLFGKRGGGMSPLAMVALGTLAYRALKGRGGLAGMLGTSLALGASRSRTSPLKKLLGRGRRH